MIRLTTEQTATLANWFLPERPGPLIGSHVINTGNGLCLVDRWPAPQVVLVETAGNYTLLGEPQALTPANIQPHIKGVVEADPAFVPLLRAAFSDLKTWPRVVLAQQEVRGMVTASDYSVRRLASTDTRLLQGLDPGLTWISNTWGGPPGLAGSGFGWGAFVAGQLASVACTFFLGAAYEDIGIVTEPQFRGLGLGWACAGALCDDVRARGHRPSWSTSPDNSASLRVAEKLGFIVQRDEVLYVTGVEIPTPASPPAKH